MRIIDEYTRDLEWDLEKELVEEEKAEWMWIWKDVEEMKWLWLLEHEDKLKKGEKKANFGQLLDEYTKKWKEVEAEMLGE